MTETKHHTGNLGEYAFLVTGGAGFIGSNLVAYLLRHGAKKVRILDNLSTGYYENLKAFEFYPGFEFMEGDIRDLDTCLNACDGIDYVSHQAALGSVPRSIGDPITTNNVNITGFLNMLVAVRDKQVKRMIFAASSSTYGDSPTLPKVENVIGKPLSPYGVTKYVNELYADVFNKLYNVKTIGLRYFNVFGPNQSPNGAYAAVIPLFISSILNNQSPKINGDGTQTRDFTYVDNAIQANIKAMLVENEEAVNQIYNVAVGDRTSLNELWDILKKNAGSDVDVIYGPDRLGDIRDSLADISKASRLLGYDPLVKVEHGLKKTFDWFKVTAL